MAMEHVLFIDDLPIKISIHRRFSSKPCQTSQRLKTLDDAIVETSWRDSAHAGMDRCSITFTVCELEKHHVYGSINYFYGQFSILGLSNFWKIETTPWEPLFTSSRRGQALHSAVRLTVVGFSGNFVWLNWCQRLQTNHGEKPWFTDVYSRFSFKHSPAEKSL